MKYEEATVCDACGVTAEMGYVIGAGDEVAEVTIFANDRESALTEFAAYQQLAMQVNADVMHDFNPQEAFAISPLVVKFKFDYSAEKIIFELRSRSLAK